MSDTYAALSAAFAQEVEREIVKSGTRLTYIPVSEVVNRLNRVLGVANWSTEIIRAERDAIDSDFVVAQVRVTAEIDGRTVVRDGFGGQKIKRTRAGDIVDLGDEYKGAVSDAFKKACQMLGVGLYLARSEDALELDEMIEIEAAQNAAEAVVVDPEIDQLYENFMSLRTALSESGVQELRTYWANWSSGRPVPKRSEFTSEELEALIGEATRILLGAEYTVSND
jgi:recombination DNA repair RAD52 pathway protein